MKNNLLKKILFLGDSHSVMTMGQVILNKINENFKNVDNQLYFYAVSGVTFLDWIKVKQNVFQILNAQKLPRNELKLSTNAININLQEELEKLQPDFLILALGTNDLINHQKDLENYLSTLDLSLRQITQKYRDLSIIWIMPPELAENIVTPGSREQLLQVLHNNNKIQLIDILGFFPDQQDQIHFHKSKATQFGIKIFEKLDIILST